MKKFLSATLASLMLLGSVLCTTPFSFAQSNAKTVSNEASSGEICSNESMTLSKSSYIYNGTACVPNVIINDELGNAIDESNYNITYPKASVYVGKYNVIADLVGEYSGSLSASFSILPKLNISSTSIYIGGTKQITASGSKSAYTYASSNKNIASVSSKGLVVGVGAGTATITVTSNGVSNTCTIRVVAPSVSLNKTSIALYTRGAYKLTASSSPKASVKWSSNNTKIATVSSTGTVTAVKSGTCTITAKIVCYGKTYYKTCAVKVVTPSVTLSKTSVSVYQKTTYTLKATPHPAGSKVTWSSTNKSIAAVNSAGKVYCYKKGTATITAKISYKGKTYSRSCKVTVVAPKLSLSKTSIKLNNSQYAKLTLKGGTGTITWKSSNTKVAIVNKDGLIKGIKSGSCTIYATRNGVSVKCTVTVYLCNYENSSIPDFGAFAGVPRNSTSPIQTDEYGNRYVIISYYRQSVKKACTHWYSGYRNVLSKLGYSVVSSAKQGEEVAEGWIKNNNAVIFGYDVNYVYTMIYIK